METEVLLDNLCLFSLSYSVALVVALEVPVVSLLVDPEAFMVPVAILDTLPVELPMDDCY